MEARSPEPIGYDDDAELTALMNRAARALEAAGITAQDLIDELPAVQEELLRQDLGDAFVDELYRLHAAHAGDATRHP